MALQLAPLLMFARSWWKAAVGFLVAAPLFFMLGQCDGKKIGAQRAALALEKANTQFLQQKARADELAAAQRLTDTIAVNRQEEALRDAIATIPDSAPDATRVQLGCERLRQAGQDTTGLSACR